MDSPVLLLDLKILEVHQHSGAEEKTLVGSVASFFRGLFLKHLAEIVFSVDMGFLERKVRSFTSVSLVSLKAENTVNEARNKCVIWFRSLLYPDCAVIRVVLSSELRCHMSCSLR